MKEIKAYENFPVRLAGISILVAVSIYTLGTYILSGYGPLAAAFYAACCLGNEIHVMRMSCVDCYYYGKRCAFGRGIVARYLFKRGDPGRFTAKSISWKELLPDMLVLVIPLLGGIALLVQKFSWSTAMALAVLLGLSSGGNYIIRTKIACKYCKQRELGCPAEQFFGKK